MNLKKIICLALAFFMALGLLAGCGKGKSNDPATTTKKEEATAKAPSYNREPQDMEKYDLDILHVEADLWNMNTDLAPTTYSGDVISSAIYSRNEYVQDTYNCFITEHNNVTFYSMASQISMLVLSGECKDYDAAYSEGSSVNQLVSQNLVENLYSFPALQLDESWWSQIVNKESTLGSGKYQTLYFTQSNLSLTAFDLTWCIYFNKQMHMAYQMDDFYEMVRENEWTIDQLYSAAKSVATMNGDESYAYLPDGKAIYGMTTYWNGSKAMMIGGGMAFTARNEDDDIVVSSFGEGYVNLCGSLAKLFGEAGTFTYGGASTESTTGNASDYLKIFNNNRALFLGAEVKSSVSDLKDFPYDFGILPMPTDTAGDDYRSWVNYLAPVLVIPKNTEAPEKAALLLDVLSYYSDQDVLPIYYDKVLRGRGAKDPDSYEMLEVINQSRCFEASIAYGWSRQFVEVVGDLLFKGNGSAASIQPNEGYGGTTGMIQTNIDNTMKAVFGE